jgi:hypothetical protein
VGKGVIRLPCAISKAPLGQFALLEVGWVLIAQRIGNLGIPGVAVVRCYHIPNPDSMQWRDEQGGPILVDPDVVVRELKIPPTRFVSKAVEVDPLNR